MKDNEIYGFEAIYDSATKCIKGVSHKAEPARYELNKIEETLKLCNELDENGYVPGKVRKFTLYYPKKREVVANRYRDRVVQRSINDNVLYPVMTRSFIKENFACQKGKGTDAAMNHFKSILMKNCVKYKNDFFIVVLDYKGYYASLQHDKVNEMLAEKLSKWICKQTVCVLDAQYDSDKGYNPGSQMVQIVGISFPDKIDHSLKEEMLAKDCERYMDDIVIIHHDYEYLKKCVEFISEKSIALGLTLHPEKTRIYDMKKETVVFMGFKYKITETGKVIINICKQNVKHEKRKLKKLVQKAKAGEFTKEHVDACYISWKAHASKGRTYKLFNVMDKYYNNLWRCENGHT